MEAVCQLTFSGHYLLRQIGLNHKRWASPAELLRSYRVEKPNNMFINLPASFQDAMRSSLNEKINSSTATCTIIIVVIYGLANLNK